MSETSTERFLRVLYENAGDGALSISYLTDGTYPITKWFTKEQIPEMAAYAIECGREHNTCLNINPRVTALDFCHRGLSEDVYEVVGVYVDFDIKGEAHAEKRLPESEEEVIGFLAKLPYPPSFIIRSGNGIHAYWLFHQPYRIRDASDRSYISGILEGFESYAIKLAREKYGWRFDNVSDLARMLRIPGTTNFKTKERPLCEIIGESSARYDPSDFEKFCKVASVFTEEGGPDEDKVDDFALMGTGSAKELMGKCVFLQHCRDDAENLSEPMWYAAITNLSRTADGQAVIHEISRPYPKYSYRETEMKYRHAANEDKPVTCEHIRDRLCFDCGRDCGVKAPIALLRTDKQDGPQEWETPIPFDEFKLPKFPVDALPPPIADYAVALAEHTQTPVDMAGTCGLAVIAVGVQGKYKVEAKPGWDEPLNLFCLSIMSPSERKSAVENGMAMPLNRYEAEYNAEHVSEYEMSQVHKRMLERRQKALEEQVSKGKADMSELEKVVKELSEYREKKPLKLYADDITTEKLVSLMAENGGRTAIISTEGGIFDMLAGIYTKHVNFDVILKGYSGDPIRVDRIGRSSENIMDPALTMFLMVQPNVLSGLMQNRTFRGRGLTARFLYSMPASFVGRRRYRTEPIPDEVYKRYEARIRNILEEEYPLKPELITLSEEADQMIEAFAEELEPRLRDEYADIADWAGKLIGNTHRIAGLLCRASIHRHEILDDHDGFVISGENMRNAIRLARYFLEHAKAAYSLMGADDTAKQCQYVLAAIKNNGLAEFKLRDIMRLCRSFKKAEELQPVLDHLIDYGYIAPDGKTVWSGKGRPPAQKYLVNPKIYES